jgi:succinate-semialdehyde dehydrogenase/glutarate-semialdehyde dehydrogenase
MGEATYAAEFFRWFAEEAVRADGMITHAPASGARIVVQHKPAGLAVLVTPWNYPAAMGTRKIAPALAAGCPVIIKPASETPLTMLALMPLLEEAGVPKGLVNVLPSKKTGALVDHMLHDPRVRVVSFTGSTGVGRKLLNSAADQVLKPAMELGGNAPLSWSRMPTWTPPSRARCSPRCAISARPARPPTASTFTRASAEEFTEQVLPPDGALKVGDGTEDGRCRPAGQCRYPRQGGEFVEDASQRARSSNRRHIAERQGLLLPADGAVERAGNGRLRA